MWLAIFLIPPSFPPIVSLSLSLPRSPCREYGRAVRLERACGRRSYDFKEYHARIEELGHHPTVQQVLLPVPRFCSLAWLSNLHLFLWLHFIRSIADCVAALQHQEREIWCLNGAAPDAVPLVPELFRSCGADADASHLTSASSSSQLSTASPTSSCASVSECESTSASSASKSSFDSAEHKHDHESGSAAHPEKRSKYGFPRKLAVVIGDEGTGISAEFKRVCHRNVYVPMHGYAGTFVFVTFRLVLFFLVCYLRPTCAHCTDIGKKKKRIRLPGTHLAPFN